MSLIQARNLTKRFRIAKKEAGVKGAMKHLFAARYEDKVALDAVSFDVNAGEAVAYVGPNGAGKSTTVKILTGILVPSAGTARVDGLDPHAKRMDNSRKIGVVFGQRTQLWWDLPVIESLRLLGDIYAVPPEPFEAKLKACNDLLELEPLLPMPARQLSLGQRMRCDLAAALLHSPRILYLDEPTIGLDVAVKARIRQFISHINQAEGVTVMLTSHDLQDIETICQRMILIDKGRVVIDGSLQAVKAQFDRSRVVHFQLREAVPDAESISKAVLSEVAPHAALSVQDYALSVTFDPAQTTAAVVVGRVMAALPVEDLRIEEPSIESIIRQLYEGRLGVVAKTQ
ncbi:MAG: ATP-binding cassette domain-containing protein [Anaerolineae bacterium]|nr:ATP-binding cassette domain-containing protein [Anaerolineae bacterium]